MPITTALRQKHLNYQKNEKLSSLFFVFSNSYHFFHAHSLTIVSITYYIFSTLLFFFFFFFTLYSEEDDRQKGK